MISEPCDMKKIPCFDGILFAFFMVCVCGEQGGVGGAVGGWGGGNGATPSWYKG